MLSFEVFSNSNFVLGKLWPLSTGSQVMTPPLHFLVMSAPGSHALYALKSWLGDFHICIYDAFTAWLLICLMSLSQWSCVHSASASSLPKSNCRPHQDCYLQPSHNPLWSSPFIFPPYSLYLSVCSNDLLSLQGTANQLIIPPFHNSSYFTILHLLLSTRSVFIDLLNISNPLPSTHFILPAGKTTMLAIQHFSTISHLHLSWRCLGENIQSCWQKSPEIADQGPQVGP